MFQEVKSSCLQQYIQLWFPAYCANLAKIETIIYVSGFNPGWTCSGEKAWRKHTLRNSFPAPRSGSKPRLRIRPKPAWSLELRHLPSWSWRWIDSSLLRRSCRRLCCWPRRSSCPPWTAAQKTHSLQWDRSSAREWIKLGSPSEPEWSALGFAGETSQWIMGIHSPSSFRVTFKTPNCKSKPGLYKLCIAQNTPACWFTGHQPPPIRFIEGFLLDT